MGNLEETTWPLSGKVKSLDPLGCPRGFYLLSLEVFWIPHSVHGSPTVTKHTSFSHVPRAGWDGEPPSQLVLRVGKAEFTCAGSEGGGRGGERKPGKDTLVPMKI